MGIETLNLLNGGIDHTLLAAIKVIMLMNVLLTIAGFAIYLAGTAWYCLGETHRPARRQTRPAPERNSAPDDAVLLAILAGLDEDPGNNLSGGPRCNPALHLRHLPSPTSTNPAQ